MSNLRPLFYIESKRFVRKRNMIIWIILLLVIFIFVNIGINRYNTMPGKEQEFNKIQDNYFKKIRNYDHYARYGIIFLFIPSPQWILFQDTTVPDDVTAKVDSSVTVQITNDLKGKSLYKGFQVGDVDLSRIFLFLICLLAIWHGYESMSTRGYLASLSSRLSDFKVNWPTAASRFILLTAAVIIMAVGVLLFIIARGVQLSAHDYKVLAGFLLVTLIMLLFFFIGGLIIGTFPSLVTAISTIFCTVYIMTYIVPGILGSIAGGAFPDSTRDYKNHMNKAKIVSEFEVQSKKEHGEFDPNKMDEARIVIEGYKKNYFPRVKGCELQLMSEIQSAVSRTNMISILSPTTFYLYTRNEASSKGYSSFMEFYRVVVEMWQKFVMFWTDQVFYKDKVLVNFLEIKGNNNVFRSRGHLPGLFIFGLSYNLVLCIILVLAFIYRYKKWMHPGPQNASAYNDLVLDFPLDGIYHILVHEKDFIDQFLNQFQGKSRGLKWKITVAGIDITNQGKQDFFLVPNIKAVPGEIMVKNLFMLYQRLFKPTAEMIESLWAEIGKDKLEKKFSKLADIDKAVVLLILARMVNTKIYILNDLVLGMDSCLLYKLKDYVEALLKPGTIILHIETINHPWIRVNSQKLIHYEDGKYEDLNQEKRKP
jgi:hypothetical protein